MRYIKQSTRDDMSGNWNEEILDMDEGEEKKKKKTEKRSIELFACALTKRLLVFTNEHIRRFGT